MLINNSASKSFKIFSHCYFLVKNKTIISIKKTVICAKSYSSITECTIDLRQHRTKRQKVA